MKQLWYLAGVLPVLAAMLPLAAAPEVGRANVAGELSGARAEIILPDGTRSAAPKLIDGKIGDNDGADFAGSGGQAVIHLATPCMVNLVRIFPGQLIYAGNASGECGVKSCRIEVLNNGYWHPVAELKDQPNFFDSGAESGDDYFIAHSFKPTKAEALRITVLESNDTGKRVSSPEVLPPEQRHSYIREIELYSANRGEAGVTRLSSLLTGDFRLAVYRNEDQAEIVLTGKPGMADLPVRLRLVNETGGAPAAGERQLTLRAGDNPIVYDLRDIPDGRYIFTVTPDDSKRVRGELARMLRIDRGADWEAPCEPVEVAGIKVFPIDDFHFAERRNVVTEVVPAEAIQASHPLAPERTQQFSRGRAALNIDDDGNYVLAFTDATRSGADRRTHYAISRDLREWRIADTTPTGKPNQLIPDPFPPLPEAARPRWQIKTPLAQATLRFHDPERDGMPPLAEVRVHWFPPGEGDVSRFGMTPWGLYPVWEKNPGEWIVLTREPLLVDKFTFESDELETETDGNDNFAPQYLTDDGKTIVVSKAAKLRRFPPYTIEYDNLRESVRIMRTYFSHDGINWQHHYLVVPDTGDHWSSQHYGADTRRIERNFYLGYLHAYHCTRQQIYPEIIYSRDGINYRRIPGSPPFVANGGPDSWLFGMIFLEGVPLEHNGEYLLPLGVVYKRQHFYNTYTDDISHITGEFLRRSFSSRNLEKEWPFFSEVGGWDGLARNMPEDASSTGIARFRKDGWLRVRAARETGELISRVFTAPGTQLVLNGRGDITVELLDADGKPLPEYSGSNAAHFSGDSTAAELKWNHGQTVRLPAAPFRLKLTMAPESELYTLNFCN